MATECVCKKQIVVGKLGDFLVLMLLEKQTVRFTGSDGNKDEPHPFFTRTKSNDICL